MSDKSKILMNTASFLLLLFVINVEKGELQIFNFIVKTWADESRTSSWLGCENGLLYWVTVFIWVALELALLIQIYLLARKK